MLCRPQLANYVVDCCNYHFGSRSVSDGDHWFQLTSLKYFCKKNRLQLNCDILNLNERHKLSPFPPANFHEIGLTAMLSLGIELRSISSCFVCFGPRHSRAACGCWTISVSGCKNCDKIQLQRHQRDLKWTIRKYILEFRKYLSPHFSIFHLKCAKIFLSYRGVLEKDFTESANSNMRDLL